MREIVVNAELRSEAGKGAARRTRSAGRIPAIVYGPETKPISVALEERAFHTAMKGANTSSIISLQVDGKVNKVILREIQRDPVTSKIVHMDFHAISMTKPLHISIPIHFVGIPEGVKTDGGIMQSTMREVEISCLPADIPEHFEIDVSELGIGDSIHLGDLKIPKAEFLADGKRTVVVISAPTVIKETVTAEEEGVEGEEGVDAAEGAEGEAAKGDEAAAAEGDKDKDKDKGKGKAEPKK